MIKAHGVDSNILSQQNIHIQVHNHTNIHAHNQSPLRLTQQNYTKETLKSTTIIHFPPSTHVLGNTEAIISQSNLNITGRLHTMQHPSYTMMPHYMLLTQYECFKF